MPSYYVDATSGNDSNDGLLEISPWKTVERVNQNTFLPGDTINFKRGETFRPTKTFIVSSSGGESVFIPETGEINNKITYKSYGVGDKPKILGSKNYSDPTIWSLSSGSIWQAGTGTVIGSELIANGNFDTSGVTGWSGYSEGGGSYSGGLDGTVYQSSPYSLRFDCITSGSTKYDLQLFYNSPEISLTEDSYYRLTFYAKATSAFTIPEIDINSSNSPYLSFLEFSTPTSIDITTTLTQYSLVFQCVRDGTDGILSFRLGGGIPDGVSLYIDDVSLVEVDSNSVLRYDVGLLVFDFEDSVGVKMAGLGSLATQGDFFYNRDFWKVQMYSATNPGAYYSDIEMAQTYSGLTIVEKSYVDVIDMDFRYFGGHGIAVGNSDHINVSGCEVHFGGGGDLIYVLQQLGVSQEVLDLLPSFLRFGNGVEFEGSCSDCVVDKNTISDIYDAGLSNQSITAGTNQNNIIYKNNIVRNCHYSAEIWIYATGSVMRNVDFVHNLCLNAGLGWAEPQRPDTAQNPPAHVAWTLPHLASTADVRIFNNIFYEWSDNALWAVAEGGYGEENFDIDYNLYYSANPFKVKFGNPDNGETYITSFNSWRSSKSKDLHSLNRSPFMRSVPDADYRLYSISPCINRGFDVGVDYDFIDTPRTGRPDIGPYEFSYSRDGKGAILLTGTTFGVIEQVTNTKLHNMVNLASISNISDSEFKNSVKIANTNASAIDILNIDTVRLYASTYCSLATFLNPKSGHPLTLIAQQASFPSVLKSSFFKLSSNWIPSAVNDSMTVVWNGSVFIEIARS